MTQEKIEKKCCPRKCWKTNLDFRKESLVLGHLVKGAGGCNFLFTVFLCSIYCQYHDVVYASSSNVGVVLGKCFFVQKIYKF